MASGMGALISRLRGLSFVRRWNFHPITRDENVAEHSFWVAVYALMIADVERYPVADIQLILRAALLHDWEEAVTGDLPSLVKRTCAADWHKVEEAGFRQLIDLVWNGEFRILHDNYPLDWRPSDPRIQKVVKAADLLDRIMYAREEQMRGSKAFDSILAETVKQLYDLKIGTVDRILTDLGHYRDEGAELPLLMTHL